MDSEGFGYAAMLAHQVSHSMIPVGLGFRV